MVSRKDSCPDSKSRSNAQSSGSSQRNRSASPVNRLASAAKETDLRTTVLKNQSKKETASNLVILDESNEEQLYESGDGTGDEEEIIQKVKLSKVDQFFKYSRTENGIPIFVCLYENCNQVIYCL
jgi:hypothetical protein